MYSLENLLTYCLQGLGMGAGMLLAARRLTHYFQLESYQFHGYFQTIGRQLKRAVDPCLLLGLCYLIVYSAFVFFAASTKGYTLFHLAMSAADAILYALAGWLIEGHASQTPLYLYCVSGARSKKAQGLLKAMGFQLVENMGGINRFTGQFEKGPMPAPPARIRSHRVP